MGKVIAEKLDVFLAVHRKANEYLEPFGWSKTNIGCSLLAFEDTHGKMRVRSMARFIKWAEGKRMAKGWIAVQLSHDLGGCENENMIPRTAGY